jgi:2-keto-4-pentenoate hydratase
MLTQSQIHTAALAFGAARRDHAPLVSLPAESAPQSLDDAYSIQEAFASAHSSPVAGYKIGAASPASQKFVGATSPFIARLFTEDCVSSPFAASEGRFFAPGVEAEFAFRMRNDVPATGAPYSGAGIAEHVGAVAPIIEICDNRFVDWKAVGLAQIVADNGFFGALVIGAWSEDWQELRLADLEVSIAIDGAQKGKAKCRNVLGEPLDSVAFTANELARRGRSLRAGDMIAIGTWTGFHLVSKSARVQARFGELGNVDCSF